MFFSEEAFERHGLFGSFDNQLKFNEFNLNETKFEVLQFENFAQNDVRWYNQVYDKLIDKDTKLSKPFDYQDKHKRFKSNIEQQQKHVNQTSVPCRIQVKNEIEQKVTEYAPKSPEIATNSEPKSKNFTSPPSSKIPQPNEKPNASKIQRDSSINQDERSALNINVSIDESCNVPPRQQSTRQLDRKAAGSGTMPTQQQASSSPPSFGDDRRIVNIMKNWYPMKFKLLYPRKSRLNSTEQKEFNEFHAKFKNRTKLTNAEVKLYKKYSHYKMLIEKEREEFLTYLKDYHKLAKEDYDFMNPQIVKYVHELIAYLESTCNSYDRYYSRLIEFNMNEYETPANHRSSFEFEKNLLLMGGLQKIIIPSITLNNQPLLITDYNRISKRIPISKTSKKMSKIPLSHDPNAEQLAIKYNCDIVMTNSSFVALMFNLSIVNADDLKLPFIIKESNNGTTKKRIIFIEKPFVQKHLSKREENEKFFKRALLVTLVKASNMPRSRADQNRRRYNNRGGDTSINQTDKSLDESEKLEKSVEQEKQQDEASNVDYDLINNLDSFGCSDGKLPSFSKLLSMSSIGNKQNIEKAAETTSNIDPKVDEIHETRQAPVKRANESLNSSSESTNKQKKSKLSKENSKKDTENGNESYDEYDEEADESEEENKLLIIDQKSEENEKSMITNTQETAKLDTKNILEQIIKSKVIDTVPKSPSEPGEPEEPEDDIALSNLCIRPKIIPLEKSTMASNEATKSSHTIEETKKIESQEIDTEEKLSLFDLISKMQEKLTNPTIKSLNHQPVPATSQAAGKPFAQHPSENPKDYVYIENIHDNVKYALWSFTIQNKQIRILVRYSTDGYINTETSSLNSAVLYPKLEYQPQFGCEKLSYKDCCRMWCKSYLRNCCDIFLCRINVFTNRLISVTNFKHGDILNKDCGFNPNQTFNHLRALFSKIINLKEGAYLFNKEPNDTKINVMTSTPNKLGSLDLHLYFTGFNVATSAKKESSWFPIDAELYLPYHYTLNRVPMLFEPYRDKKKMETQYRPPNRKSKRRAKAAKKN